MEAEGVVGAGGVGKGVGSVFWGGDHEKIKGGAEGGKPRLNCFYQFSPRTSK